MELKKNTEELSFPLSGWMRYFFQYALEKKKNFYWSWKYFMITVRKQKDKLALILEIPLKKAPFLAQKHIDITNIPKDELVNSLLFLYNHYESSPMLRRNREHSIRFLSLISFSQLIANHDIKKLPGPGETSRINRLLVAYIINTLDSHNVPFLCKKPTDHIYSVFQLTSNNRSLKA